MNAKHRLLDIAGRAYELFRMKKIRDNFLHDNFEVRVLCYHDISAGQLQNFERQIKFLTSEYHVATTEELRNFLLGRGFLPGVNIYITFDDGSVDQYEAATILEKYGIHACYFVYTGDIGTENLTSRPHSKLKPLTWNQVIDLDRRGHEIGSHTVHHKNLAKIQPADAYNELAQSKNILEEKLAKKVDFFAFPYGTDADISDEAASIARDIYPFDFCYLSGANRFAATNRHLVRRTGVGPEYSLYHLRALIAGTKDFLYQGRYEKIESMLRYRPRS